MKALLSVDDLLLSYLTAFESSDITAIDQLFEANALIEVPMLKPNRLVGKPEIHQGHSDMFASLESIKFEVKRCLADDKQAIAEASATVVRRDTDSYSLQLGIVAIKGQQELQRLSLYCDARNLRLWSDRTIL
ncbi:MAG: hypothetical protein ACI9LO_003191 [Planctomycetota bacterium]|jgi:hypothetical protein